MMYAHFNCISNNAHIHDLFRHYGLKASLLRLKAIEALISDSQGGSPLSAQDIAQLINVPGISLLSIREMFKRLQGAGMVILHDNKTYSLSAQAARIIQQRVGVGTQK